MVASLFGTSDTSSQAVNDAQAGAAENALSGAASGGKGLGQDAFLKLLVAQISHQDPLKPMDDTSFVAQLAQFSSLEQTIGINKRLDALASQNLSTANTQYADLIGKSVSMKGDTATLNGSGFAVPIQFTLGAATKTTELSIVNAAGQTVRTMHLGPRTAGVIAGSWDGKSDAGVAQPAGIYTVSIKGLDGAGASVDVIQEMTGVVQSVDLSKGSPNLQLDGGVSAPVSDLLRINQTTNQ